MITLTAQMRIRSENPFPFTIGVSSFGDGSLLGEKIDERVNFDGKNILSIESEIVDRGNIEQPSYGIVSNGGNMSFKDSNSRFLEMANAGFLKDGHEVKVFLENTISKRGVQVGNYYTSDWDYDNDNKSVSVSFKDKLEEWQEINIDEIPLSNSGETLNMYYFFDILKKEAENRGFVFVLDESAINAMTKTQSDTFYMESGTLWSNFVKICEICCIYMYQDKNGKVFVFSDFNEEN